MTHDGRARVSDQRLELRPRHHDYRHGQLHCTVRHDRNGAVSDGPRGERRTMMGTTGHGEEERPWLALARVDCYVVNLDATRHDVEGLIIKYVAELHGQVTFDAKLADDPVRGFWNTPLEGMP